MGTLGHDVETDLWRALDRCNSLFIVPGDYTEAIESKLVSHAERAIASGKHILCGVRLRPEQIEALRSQCKEKGVDFVYFPQESSDLFEGKPRRMYRPNAPVVFVGEVLEGINAIDVTLALISHFRKQGFRTSAILPSDLAALCGAHSHQEFASPTRPEEQRIEAMNYAMKKIDTEEIPDVIIVQLPGGVLPINDIATSQFGVHAFMWSQAVTPDCFVLCAPFQAFEEREYGEMNRLFTYRYGYAVDCVHLSNATLDMMNLNTSFEVSLYFAPMDDTSP